MSTPSNSWVPTNIIQLRNIPKISIQTQMKKQKKCRQNSIGNWNRRKRRRLRRRSHDRASALKSSDSSTRRQNSSRKSSPRIPPPKKKSKDSSRNPFSSSHSTKKISVSSSMPWRKFTQSPEGQSSLRVK
jgi:hypothetical protein